MAWTNEQLNAINARNTGVIVSAAAGSGKTSVLVERLIRVLSDTENKTPADRLVVVTFTNDAAAQMKQRLSDALSSKIADEPDNLWLCSQQALLRTAKISTIHSFCFDLIRENINSLDVSAGFRIIDDTEEIVLKRKAAENVFEHFYSKRPEVINRLSDFFSAGNRNDSALEENLLEIYDFLMSIPYYEDWLNDKIEFWKKGFCPESDPFAQIFIGELESVYRDALIKAEYVSDWFEGAYAEKLAEKRKKDEEYGCCVKLEAELLNKAIENLKDNEKPWDERVTAVKFEKSFTAPVQVKKDEDTERAEEFGRMKGYVKAIRMLSRRQAKAYLPQKK